jgi:hypothetical protein
LGVLGSSIKVVPRRGYRFDGEQFSSA